MNPLDVFNRIASAISPAKPSNDPAQSGEEANPLQDVVEQLIDGFLKETAGRYYDIKCSEFESGRKILDSDADVQIAVIHYIYTAIGQRQAWQLRPLQTSLMARNQPFNESDLLRLVTSVSVGNVYQTMPASILRHVRRHSMGNGGLTPSLRASLEGFYEILGSAIQSAEARKWQVTLEELLGSGDTPIATAPDPGETWADAALSDLSAMAQTEREAWHRLFHHAQTAEAAKPSRAWSQTAETLVKALGKDFAPLTGRWFSLVTTPRIEVKQHVYGNHTYESHESTGSERNISLLKGLAWCCAGRDEPELARALAKLADGCLKKIPGMGPWAIRAATAAVWSLGEMSSDENVTALSSLRLRVTHRSALAQIEKAIEAVAKKKGVPRDDLEDLSVPTYGLNPSGDRTETFGEYTAHLILEADGSVAISWYGPGGKALKSAPASVKKDFAAELKGLKADSDALQRTLSAQKQRLETFLLTNRVWPFEQMRGRYFDHPVLGCIARRLIWCFGSGESTVAGVWDAAGKQIVDIDGSPLELSNDTEVRLWHPIKASVEQIEQWRSLVESKEIRQPFKQAHREVYILTDAEMSTRVYSNRFASHLLKQHQFNQLAGLRGWKNQLRLMVDAEYAPPHLLMPKYGLRAEFWVEGAGEDRNDTGTYLYLTTDQVRFYPLNAPSNSAHAGGGGYASDNRGTLTEPLPLDTIPPLVFSEVMRDVDLFVGVASVGNDPVWSDGGGDGRHQTYWQEYAFGELTASAQTRSAVLAKLLPRLKISSQCRLDGRFLRVTGKLRTYKIHLGSGNILMEPNDQYLCIVQAPTGSNNLFLPFDGDSRLSVIISKAFLLADDTKITDPTITRQIQLPA